MLKGNSIKDIYLMYNLLIFSLALYSLTNSISFFNYTLFEPWSFWFMRDSLFSGSLAAISSKLILLLFKKLCLPCWIFAHSFFTFIIKSNLNSFLKSVITQLELKKEYKVLVQWHLWQSSPLDYKQMNKVWLEEKNQLDCILNKKYLD